MKQLIMEMLFYNQLLFVETTVSIMKVEVSEAKNTKWYLKI